MNPSLVNAILTFAKLLKEAQTPSVATWQPHFIKQSTDWCLFIETELTLLPDEECEQLLTLTQQQTKDPLPSTNDLLDALHVFFKLLLQNIYMSNALYFHVLKNYRFLTIQENDVLVKDMASLAHETSSKNILKDMLEDLH